MNITKQKLTSLLASIALLGAAWFSTQNAMAEEQKTEANPKVVIQSNNQQFAEKYPLHNMKLGKRLQIPQNWNRH